MARRRGRDRDWLSALHEGGISGAGLQSVLQKVGVRVSKRAIYAANQIQFEKVGHTELVELTTGGDPFVWEFAEPNLLIQEMVNQSPSLQDIYAQAARRCGCSPDNPWEMIIGFDEYTPGSKMKPKSNKKVMVFSFSFLQLGKTALNHESCWFSPCCLRTNILTKADGGWSHLLSRMLRLLLVGPLAVRTVGVPLLLHGQIFHLYARVGVMLSDLDGWRIALDWRGAGSVRPCFLCKNCWDKKTEHEGDGQHNIGCHRFENFEPMDDDTLFGIMDLLVESKARVLAGLMSAGDFEELQKAIGFNCNPKGMLADKTLRPHLAVCQMAHTDWVHNMCQDGCMTKEVHAFVSCAKRDAGIHFEFWQTLLRSDWCFPTHRKTKTAHLHELFNKYHEKHSEEKQKFKSLASDMVTLYALLRHVIERELQDIRCLDHPRRSFQACCRVMDIILTAKRTNSDLSNLAVECREAIRDHMILHQRAFGLKYVVPKTHMMFHVPNQWGDVYDMFVIERLNLRLKALAEPIDRLSRYERSVVASLLTKQCAQLAEGPVFHNGLIGTEDRLASFPNVLFASGVQYEGRRFAKDDCVFSYENKIAGCVLACAEDGGCLYVILRMFQLLQSWGNSGRYQLTADVRVLDVRSIWEVCAWYIEGDTVVVLR